MGTGTKVKAASRLSLDRQVDAPQVERTGARALPAEKVRMQGNHITVLVSVSLLLGTSGMRRKPTEALIMSCANEKA